MTTQDTSPTWKRRLVWILSALILIALVLVALAPRILSQPPFHGWVFRKATSDIHGHAKIDHLRLRWFSPPVIEGFHIESPDGDPVLNTVSCAGSTSIFRWLFTPANLGTFRVNRPELTFVLRPDGNNLGRTFASKSSEANGQSEVTRTGDGVQSPVTAYIQILDGRFVFRRVEDPDGWSIEGLNVTVGIESEADSDGRSRIRVPAEQLLDHVDLTPRICNDLLKFVTPALANSSWVQGQVSLSLDGASLPLGTLAQGQLSGQMTIHSVQAGAGPVVTDVLSIFGVPDSIQLVNESRVQFKMEGGRVYHEGFRFQTGNFQVETSGWVGLDESLDLVAKVTVPSVESETDRPRLISLRGQTLEIPVSGTLGQPRVDLERLMGDDPEALPAFLGDLLDDADIAIEDLMDALRQRRQQRLKNSSDGSASPEAPFRDRLRELLRGPMESDPPTAEESEENRSETPSPKKQRPRLGRGLLRELLERAASESDEGA